MKVITGSAKGRVLLTPEGLDTRPTADRIKHSIFNAIQFDVEGRRVLDLFAGSGQLGIEALSRGAKECFFIDLDKDAQSAISQNIKNCGFTSNSKVFGTDFETFLKSAVNSSELSAVSSGNSDFITSATPESTLINLMSCL